jgi:uncharacterized protein (TIGR02246 family)
MDTRDEAAIGAVVDHFVRAWNEHDMGAFAALFADAAEFVNAIGLHWCGRAQIEAAQARNHATIFRESRIENMAARQRLLVPGVALVHATWDLVGQRGRDGHAIPPRAGIITMVLVQAGDAWPIAAFQNTDIVRAS